MSDTRDKVRAEYERLGGNVSATARSLGLARGTVQYHIRKSGGAKKPLVGGNLTGIVETVVDLPAEGKINRFILTSAQNNTRVNPKVWENLVALAEWYGAKLMVGTFSYNKNAYGKLAVKRGTKDDNDHELWYDDKVVPHLCDERIALGKGLVWCGEMNIQPTAQDPLEGLETYSGRSSSIFPHAKHAMRSIASMPGEGVKLNYTTGTVTQKNYIQKKAGLVAEHHHGYGALLVEVNHHGNWWVRQLDADEKGRIYDLDLLAQGGEVTAKHRVEAINWGDQHASTLDESVEIMSLDMLAELRPKIQFHHDIYEGVATNHHGANNPHDLYRAYLRGMDKLAAESDVSANMLRNYHQSGCIQVVVPSNHDYQWIERWLREHDYRKDPCNAELFLELQLAKYQSIRNNDRLNVVEWLMKRAGCPEFVRFLDEDERYPICNGKIECGMHGHLGPNGARGTPANLSKIGRRANVGHMHTAGIYNGLYVAGTSTTLKMGYNKGPSSWTHSHIVTYPNGKRTIITMYAGNWRA